MKQRELKFRAWLKELDEMVEHEQIIAPFIIEPTDSVGGKLKFQKLFRYYSTTGHSSWENELFEDIILMQFTGLLDKNGKEIYEGDIVTEWRDKYRREGTNFTVEYFQTGFRGICKEGDKYGPFTKNLYVNSDNPILEVIGNIYEKEAV